MNFVKTLQEPQTKIGLDTSTNHTFYGGLGLVLYQIWKIGKGRGDDVLLDVYSS